MATEPWKDAGPTTNALEYSGPVINGSRDTNGNDTSSPNNYGVIGWYPQQERPTSLTPTSKMFKSKILVKLSDGNVPMSVITSYFDFPYRFKPHNVIPGFWCINWDFEQHAPNADIRVLWVHWSTEIPAALIRNGKPVYDDVPTKRPAEIARSYYIHRRRMRMTYKQGTQFVAGSLEKVPTIPVVTTAGEDLFLEIECQCRAFICKKNVGNVQDIFDEGNGKFLNSDAVRLKGNNYKPLQLMATDIEFSPERFEFGDYYYIMTYKIVVAPDQDGWCEKLRNAGYHEKGIQQIDQTIEVTSGRTTTIKVDQPYLKAIQVGQPQLPQYPSSPVLIDPDGFAYRNFNIEANEKASTPNKLRTGPVLSTQGEINGGIGITPQQWKDAELKFWPYLAIPFSKYIPTT